MPRHHFVYGGRHRNLRRVLDQWAKLILRAAHDWEGKDWPWWYRERAMVGVLAAACWREGGTALEEYSGKKGRSEDVPYTGRLDLFLSLNRIEYQVEAKFKWNDCSQSSRQIRKEIERSLSAAVRDARDVTSDVRRRFGVVFAAPYLKDGDPETMVAAIERWRTAVDETRCGAYAWALPREGWAAKWKGFVHPGVAMLVRAP